MSASLAIAARWAATAALAGLLAAEEYYHYPWIAIAAAVLGTVGIHAIPSAVQVKSPPQDKP